VVVTIKVIMESNKERRGKERNREKMRVYILITTVVVAMVGIRGKGGIRDVERGERIGRGRNCTMGLIVRIRFRLGRI